MSASIQLHSVASLNDLLRLMYFDGFGWNGNRIILNLFEFCFKYSKLRGSQIRVE